MQTLTTRSIVHVTRYGRRAASALAALATLSACAPPREAPGPAPAPAPPAAPGRPEAPAGARIEPEVTIALLVDTTRVELGAPSGLELFEMTTGQLLGRTQGGQRYTVTSDPAGTLLIAPPAGGAAGWEARGTLVARSRGAEPVQINGQLYRGSVQVRSPRPGRLTVVNAVRMEDYLMGVVPREIGQLSPGMIEAAKAQAVAARTYSVARKERRVGLGFNFYADERDQVYGGVRAENEEVNRAVRETAGEILVYRGTPIDAYYHSTCAGQTAAIEEVWNERPRPYLSSVVDVNSATGQAWDHTSSRFRWTTRWTGAQMTEILNRTLADSLPAGRRTIGTLRDMRVLDRTPSGRVRTMRIETSAGNFAVGRDRVRWILLTPEGRILNSSKFDVRVVRNASGAVTEVVADGGGWGHGIGMCQVGARNRALAGQDYRQILLTYYVGAEIQDLY